MSELSEKTLALMFLFIMTGELKHNAAEAYLKPSLTSAMELFCENN